MCCSPSLKRTGCSLGGRGGEGDGRDKGLDLEDQPTVVTGPLGDQADSSQDPAGFGHSCCTQKGHAPSLKARVIALCGKQNILWSNGDSPQPLPPVTPISPICFLNASSEMVGAFGISVNCDLGDEI